MRIAILDQLVPDTVFKLNGKTYRKTTTGGHKIKVEPLLGGQFQPNLAENLDARVEVQVE